MHTSERLVNIEIFLFLFAATFIWMLFFAFSLTPMSVYEGMDSLVFKQMGLTILLGKTPYIDLFDHKGPLLYLINAVGLYVGNGGKWGLFMLHVLNISGVLYCWYQTSMMMLNRSKSILALICGLLLLTLMDFDGNTTEDWSLLPISYAIYLLVRWRIKGQSITFFNCFLLGIGIGAIVLIRINNMAAILFVVLIWMIWQICLKDYSKVIVDVSAIMAGVLLIVLPFLVLYRIIYGAEGFYQMLYGSFIFNLEYLTAGTVYHNRFRIIILHLVIASVTLYLMIRTKLDRTLKLSVVGCFIVTLLAIGTRGSGSYFILLAPLYVISASIVFQSTKKWQHLLVAGLMCVAFPYKIYLSRMIFKGADFCNRADYVMSQMSEEDISDIWNYDGNVTAVCVLHRNHQTQGNRVILRFQTDISDALKQSEVKLFNQKHPNWVVTSKPVIRSESYESSIIAEHYTLKYTVNKEEGSMFSDLMFYRKDTNW